MELPKKMMALKNSSASVNYIEQYWTAIQTGAVLVCTKIRVVYKHLVYCIHHPGKFHYDNDRAQHAITFIEKYCRQSKGKFGGKPLQLDLWQKAITAAVFGFVDDQGLRQYREVLLIVARKNGKSTWGSAVANYMLFADQEHGPEVYSAATKRDQAKTIWEESRRMISKSPVLRRRAKCLVSVIKCTINDGVFKPLAAESHTEDGLNPSAAFLDEIHEWKDKNLYDVIVDGESSRDQPLTIITSTAGTVRDNVYDLKYQEAIDVLNAYSGADSYLDDRMLPVIYEIDAREEWKKPECWIKANPGLGTIKNRDILAGKVLKAQKNPAYEKNLLCKDFNVRETDTQAFLSFEELNNPATFDFEKLVPRPRYAIGGFDLSETIDLTCATALFQLTRDNPMLYSMQMYWIPEDVLEARPDRDKVPYDLWHKQGFLRTCPGNRIDYHMVYQWFVDMQTQNHLYFYAIGYDRYSASYLVNDMSLFFGEKTMDQVIQGAKTLSIPMRNLKAILAKKQINYGNNPITKWCLANAKASEDTNRNIKPVKNRNGHARDDGFLSLLDAYTSYERIYNDYLALLPASGGTQ